MGIGNEPPDSNEEDFTPRAYTGLLRLQRQIAPAWFAGITASFAYRELEEVEPEGLLDLGLVGGTEDGRVAGIGLVVTRDTRDRSVYPRAGGYQELEIRVHEAALGSDWSYTSLSSDLKAYVSVRESQVLALQAVGTVQSAAPPFDLLPQIGGDSLLRGYFGGRWRDRALLAFQAEYRVPVKWRIGAVAFAGVGQVAHDADGFRLDGFRASGGAGLRFLLSPEEGFQLRADWGAGDGSSGFYLAFGEAF
jgi:outer membrane protein assembly factor BamA